MQQLSKVADEAELEALERAMEEGMYVSPATQCQVSLADQHNGGHEVPYLLKQSAETKAAHSAALSL